MSIKSKKTTKTGKIQEKVPACKDVKTRKKPTEAQVSDHAGKIKVVMTNSEARVQDKRPKPEMKAEKGLNAGRWCESGCGYD